LTTKTKKHSHHTHNATLPTQQRNKSSSFFSTKIFYFFKKHGQWLAPLRDKTRHF